MSFTKGKQNNIKHFDYKINDHTLERVESFVDLGVTFDCHLKFNDHINKIINSAHRALGFIFRSSAGFKKKSSFQLLYNAYVRSKLEYCSVAYSLRTKIQSSKIERV